MSLIKASDKRSSCDFVSNFPPFINAAAGMHLFANCLGSPTLNPIYLNLFCEKNYTSGHGAGVRPRSGAQEEGEGGASQGGGEWRRRQEEQVSLFAQFCY